MRTWWNNMRLRALFGDRGETPVAVMLGLVVLGVLVLSAGPALVSFTAQSAANSNDRRADKALAVLTDTARRAPWKTLEVGGPYVETVELAGAPADVTTWIEPDPTSSSRLLITKAVAEHMSGVDCSAASPSALPTACIVRTATVASTATDIRPVSSPGVSFAQPSTATSVGATVLSEQALFTLNVTQDMKVAIIAKTSSDVRLELVSNDISRACATLQGGAAATLQHCDTRTPTWVPAGGDAWRFANVALCKQPAGREVVTAKVTLPAGVRVSDLIVLTTPAPGTCT